MKILPHQLFFFFLKFKAVFIENIRSGIEFIFFMFLSLILLEPDRAGMNAHILFFEINIL